MTLGILILLPMLAALVVAFAPKQHAKTIALVGTLAPIASFISTLAGYNWLGESGDQFVFADFKWFEPLGITFSLGADNISMLLVALTLLLGPICVLASFTAITDRVRTYYAWLLALQGAMTGVFLARDMVLFYVFFEFTLVPMYVLISLYGSTNRKAAATKFFLYTFTGSILTLAAMIFVAWKYASAHSGVWSFALSDLAATARALPLETQTWVFLGFMAGFAVKVPLFPVHTWLPLAHTEAPTAGSVILAGVLLKLGTYGIYRFAIGFTPAAAWDLAPWVAVLAIIGIIYGGLICWVQTDVKKLVAYSSVSHLGFCVLGLFAFTSVGITGSVMYMINHGLSTGALFLLIGMVYERYHTRSLKELGGLAAKMPVWATFMVFFAMASVGLPGLNGFVSEFMCLLGAFQAGDAWNVHVTGAGQTGPLGPWFAVVAGVGMIVTAIYLLFMLGKIVWGTLVEPHGHGHGHGDGHASALPTDLSKREIGVLAPLAVLCLVLGLFPTPVLRVLEAPSRELAEVARKSAPSRTGTASTPVAGAADAKETLR
jgi:NADH-quinone oxidoreductase subunit M